MDVSTSVIVWFFFTCDFVMFMIDVWVLGLGHKQR